MEEITFKIILPLAFIAMTILALHFWTLYLKYKKQLLEKSLAQRLKELQDQKDFADMIIKGFLVKDEKGYNVTGKFIHIPTTEEDLQRYAGLEKARGEAIEMYRKEKYTNNL